MSSAPIFIIGVPRSGTTLLRTMLDSHPNIASGPETPWLCAHQPRSVGALVEYLCTDKHGFIHSYGGSRADVITAARAFTDSLLSAYARRRGKRRWAEKTPENLLHLPFLTELFPDARFIHLTRDPLDVALSTSVVAPHRKGISESLERSIKLAPGLQVENSVFTATLRHGHWERKIAAGLAGLPVLKISYEELVRSPEAVMRRLLDFVGEPFDKAVLDYAQSAHDQPGWEWGSADVAHLARTTGGVTPDRIGRAERELSAVERDLLSPITGRPDRACTGSTAALASTAELNSERFTRFAAWLDGLARPLGLHAAAGGPGAWEYPWLWLNALASVSWPDAHLVDVSSGLSPVPWLAALLGAHVTLLGADAASIHLWQRLRTGLGVRVDWRLGEAQGLPLPHANIDVITGAASSLPPDAASKAANALRRGGILALTVDARTAARRAFEDQVWLHPAFGQRERPVWNDSDPSPFPDAPVGAAVLRKV